jgi:hypothetical protein
MNSGNSPTKALSTHLSATICTLLFDVSIPSPEVDLNLARQVEKVINLPDTWGKARRKPVAQSFTND